MTLPTILFILALISAIIWLVFILLDCLHWVEYFSSQSNDLDDL